MKLLICLFMIIIINSCATYTLSRDVQKEAQKICINSEGNGRLTINNSKYVFAYDSLLEYDNHKWSLELDFPLRSTEVFELDWSENNQMKFHTSLDQKLLRENSNINPKELEQFIEKIGFFLKDLLRLKGQRKEELQFKWRVEKNTLVALDAQKQTSLKFDAIDADGYFKKMTISYLAKAKSKKKKEYKMEFLLRKCFNK